MTARLPIPGGDDGDWGTILNVFLEVSLNNDGTLQTSALQQAGGITATQVGIASGVASLDSSTKVPTTQLGSGTASSSNFLRGDGTWAVPSGGGTVTSVFGRTGSVTAQSGDYTAAEVGALPSTDDLSAISSANATAGTVSMNSHKITNLTNGSNPQDAATFSQIPTALPPNGSAGGDLTGTYPDPTVARVNGVIISGTPSTGQALVASDTTEASWETLQLNQQPVVTKSSSYALSTDDGVVLANASSAAITVTLPTAVGNSNLYNVKKIDSSAHTVTMSTSDGQTIDGGATAVIKVQYAGISVVSDGSNWYISETPPVVPEAL